MVKILDNVTVSGASSEVATKSHSTFQGTVTGTSGACSASIDIEVSNDGVHWVWAATITLLAADVAVADNTDGFYGAQVQKWFFFRARVYSLNGTGAAVSVYAGQ